jgi:hypothetical protein
MGERVTNSLDFVAVVACGLTTLGVVLDWGVDPQTKRLLQERLEGLLYKFRYTTWRTFGRAEIEFSMRVFDLFGWRFFSWRRLIVVAAFLVLVGGSLTIVTSLEVHKLSLGAPPVSLVLYAILTGVLLATSISITIWICQMMLRLPGGATIAGSAVAFVLHLLLLAFWRPFVGLTTNYVAVWSSPNNSLLTDLWTYSMLQINHILSELHAKGIVSGLWATIKFNYLDTLQDLHEGRITTVMIALDDLAGLWDRSNTEPTRTVNLSLQSPQVHQPGPMLLPPSCLIFSIPPQWGQNTPFGHRRASRWARAASSSR